MYLGNFVYLQNLLKITSLAQMLVLFSECIKTNSLQTVYTIEPTVSSYFDVIMHSRHQ